MVHVSQNYDILSLPPPFLFLIPFSTSILITPYSYTDGPKLDSSVLRQMNNEVCSLFNRCNSFTNAVQVWLNWTAYFQRTL